jgi:hypothetical protein
MPVLGYTRDVGDRYAVKVALDRLALALVGLEDHAAALVQLTRAATLAADLDDRPHEADLLWRAAVEHDALGQCKDALACARAAVLALRALENPKAEWYAHHLATYQSGALGEALAAPVPGHANANGPGPLRMALSAATAMAKFVGSGFQTAAPTTYRARLAACAGCTHHTGLRCRICGCITGAKARLIHERCPAGRWPS